MMKIKLVQLDSELPVPAYANRGDAAVDLYSRENLTLLRSNHRQTVSTGIVIELHVNTFGLILPRSGLAKKNGVTLVNSPGLIDSGYRGEIKVVLINTDPENDYEIKRGDRIAQMLILSLVPVEFSVLDSIDGLSDSSRSSDGFGSTGS
jgi:dUTP pyrophosphatase